MKKGQKMSEASKRKLSESKKGIPQSEEHKKALSKVRKGKPSSLKGRPQSEEHKKSLSKVRKGKPSPNKGKKASDKTRQKLSDSHKGQVAWNKGKKTSSATRKKQSDAAGKREITEENRQRLSAGLQHVPYEEWEGFARDKKYCPKFNDECRESCRAKYNHRCFMCGKPQSENKTKTYKIRKLSVHHVDMDKAQGCESNWKLVPLCMECHPTTHNDEMITRLGYLIKDKKRDKK
jgi:hypothetical protein